MSEQFSIEFPASDVRQFFSSVERASKDLGKPMLSSLQWAARLLLQSLAASTKVSKKLRPVVKNPDKGYKTDMRKAPYGVMRWDRTGKQYFKPIYRTGEFGKLRFFDKKTVAWYDRSSGSGQWVKIASGPDVANPETIVPGIMTDKRRIIGRRGFAKKVWLWSKGAIGSGGTATLMRVPNIASVKINRSQVDPSITVVNRVNYLQHALKGGEQQINTAMARAMRKMESEIDRKLVEKMGLGKLSR
jgi:hypothetical protein